MSRRDRTPSDLHVLVAAPPAEVIELGASTPDLLLDGCRSDEFIRRTLDLRPRVAVWAEDDAAAGLKAVVKLRSARTDTRLVLITPAEAETERLAALEAGVEALARPVSTSELAGRLRLLLRRKPGRRTRLTVGDGIQLDLDRRELLRGDEWIHLRPKEARLLELFGQAPGRVLTREHILERVWGPNHQGDPRTVDVHVRWLRSKIEPDPHDPVWLLTVRGVGYRLETLPLTER